VSTVNSCLFVCLFLFYVPISAGSKTNKTSRRRVLSRKLIDNIRIFFLENRESEHGVQQDDGTASTQSNATRVPVLLCDCAATQTKLHAVRRLK